MRMEDELIKVAIETRKKAIKSFEMNIRLAQKTIEEKKKLIEIFKQEIFEYERQLKGE